MPIPPIEGRIVNEPDTTQPPSAIPPSVETLNEQRPPPTAAIEASAQANGRGELTETVRHEDGCIRNDAQSEQAASGRRAVETRPEAFSSGAGGYERVDAPARKSPMGAAAMNKGKPLEAIKPDGAVGEALKALAQDLKAGEKAWGRHAVADAAGQIWLKWPDAFAGYGLTAKAILDDLHGREWLCIDPMAPLKKVMEADFEGGVVKAIRLAPAISQWLIEEAGGTRALRDAGLSRVEANDTSPKDGEQERGVPEPGMASPRATAGKQGRKPRHQVTEHAKQATQGPVDQTTREVTGVVTIDRGVEITVAPAGALSVDDVIELIKDLPAQVQLDGFCALSKADVMSACKKHGVRITHKRLADLCKQEPGRLLAEGDVVRYRV
jgi:conjugal transfer pilus assembly protein TraI